MNDDAWDCCVGGFCLGLVMMGIGATSGICNGDTEFVWWSIIGSGIVAAVCFVAAMIGKDRGT